ncbi:hypothetical protein [Paraburkholderia sp. BCC1876]|uniref:PGAP1-like alpha/beta domain-containing protein n=1 Tax=Paraburkholderia sp. BCC1876 TaxID=2676303 RepID=UPI001591C16A|nr:hypothetical protein [Paraburkholderia sp. BCC1876]
MSSDTDNTAAPVSVMATRRVPLMFDGNNDPFFASVTSPETFLIKALGVLPPKHVIPVIFVPGIMGTNICSNGKLSKDGEPAWRPPNGSAAGLGEWWSRRSQTPKERQKQMSPETTRVDETGLVTIPKGLYTLTKEEAQRRHWGEVHSDSYNAFLAWLELNLNDQYEFAGKPGSKLLPSWETAKTLQKTESHSFGNETVDIKKIWNPMRGSIAGLTDAEVKKAGDYYFPVWACGYNWLQSNEKSSDALVARINEVLDYYKKSKTLIPEGRVIVITHSMGGLVARRAAQKVPGLIMGVLHGVQPVVGAPVVYRRFRAGTERDSYNPEAAILSSIIGYTPADVTCVLGNSPGPMELLPTKYYPSGWLEVEVPSGGKSAVIKQLPAADPYSEIYSKQVKNVWWGMIDESLLDPAGIVAKKDVTAFDAYQKNLLTASDFHDAVKLECHRVTYAYYGGDTSHAAYSQIRWVTKDQVEESWTPALVTAQPTSHNDVGQTVVTMPNGKAVTFNVGGRGEPKKSGESNTGDGTVPLVSGAKINDGSILSCRMTGFDHQNSYNDDNVRDLTLYCVAKIAQEAIAVQQLPQSKGK